MFTRSDPRVPSMTKCFQFFSLERNSWILYDSLIISLSSSMLSVSALPHFSALLLVNVQLNAALNPPSQNTFNSRSRETPAKTDLGSPFVNSLFFLGFEFV